MNKIIPFNKDIKFNENIGEITSIALDDTLKFIDSYTISGDLIVRGCHKYNDLEEEFSYSLPTQIAVDNKYDTSKARISVDDFYYEIINDDILKVKIDLILDDLYYKETKIESLVRNDNIEKTNEINEVLIKQEKKEKDKKLEKEETIVKEDVMDLFKETNTDKEYSIYRVYLVGPSDTLDTILEKYKITSEELGLYNDLANIKPGVKIIIPSIDE